MFKKLHFKSLLLLAMMVMGAGNAWAETVTLTSAQIKAGSGSSSYGACSATDGGGNTWTAYAIKKEHSGATSDYHHYQIKKYASNTAYYVQVPILGTKITSLKITVSSASNARGGGGNTATLFFSSSNSTSATGTGVVSGTGDGEVTLNCSSLNLNTGYITASGAVRIWDIEVTYETSSIPVDVTGVTLNKTSMELYEGDTETLTATITPNNASDKTVTWTSSNSSIATVSETGLVTAVTPGSATISVKTNDGSYTASCNVTVQKAPVPSVTLDFTSNTDWEFPTNGTNTTGTYDANGYSISIKAEKNFYFDNDHLFIGKNNSTITLPKFPFNVSKIVFVGYSTASKDVTFNVFVGSDAVSTVATNSKLTHTFAIDEQHQDAGTVYVLKITNAYNMRVQKLQIFGYENVSVSSAGYATLCAPADLDFTGLDVKAYKAIEKDDYVDFEPVTEVPAGAGVLLKAKQGEQSEYEVPVIATASALTGNVFVGVANADETINGNNGNFYVLRDAPDGLGFYKVNASTYHLKQGTAYLSLNNALAKNFIDIDNTTSIGLIGASKNDAQMFNLAGQRVGNDYKGIVIVNGKKVIR